MIQAVSREAASEEAASKQRTTSKQIPVDLSLAASALLATSRPTQARDRLVYHRAFKMTRTHRERDPRTARVFQGVSGVPRSSQAPNAAT
eukprot:scaffold301_cov243-Pinguiococcus_pyrenoidosus.AAC.140